jgi:hypothetical protein
VLVIQSRVDLVPWGSLPRSEYKSRLVERQTERNPKRGGITWPQTR